MRTNPIKGRTRYHREENTRHCREVAPTRDQLRLIDKSLRDTGKTTVADCIMFLAFSGVRVNETLPLLWSNVDWQSQLIHVKRQKRGINPFVPIGIEMRDFFEEDAVSVNEPLLVSVVKRHWKADCVSNGRPPVAGIMSVRTDEIHYSTWAQKVFRHPVPPIWSS